MLQDAFHHRGVTILGELAGGHRNRVFLAERNGQKLVAKTTRHSEAALQWLIPVLNAATRVGLCPPMLIPDEEGRYGTGQITIEPYVHGAPASRQDLFLLAPKVTRLHRTLSNHPQRPGYRAFVGRAPRKHLDHLQRKTDRLPKAGTTVIHGDLNCSNVVIGANGLSVIDWDEARVDHPSFDLPLRNPAYQIRLARHAREIVAGWHTEPAYARGLVRQITAAPTA